MAPNPPLLKISKGSNNVALGRRAGATGASENQVPAFGRRRPRPAGRLPPPYDAVEEARERAMRARVEYQIADRSPLPTQEAMARLKEPIAEHEAEIARLIEERDERAARSADITRLVTRLDNYIGDLGASTKITLFSGSLPARRKGEAPADTVVRCRKDIDKLRDRISAISTAPRPLDELIARATAEIEALASRGAPNVDGLVDDGLASHGQPVPSICWAVPQTAW